MSKKGRLFLLILIVVAGVLILYRVESARAQSGARCFGSNNAAGSGCECNGTPDCRVYHIICDDPHERPVDGNPDCSSSPPSQRETLIDRNCGIEQIDLYVGVVMLGSISDTNNGDNVCRPPAPPATSTPTSTPTPTPTNTPIPTNTQVP